MAIKYLTHIKHWWKDPYRNRPNWSEKVTVFLTIAIVGVSISQAVIYFQQKRIMESSGHQTQQLIDAANIQACAANRNANAAASFSESAKGINTQTALAVGDFQRMATAAENNIRAIQESSRNDQRAWLGVADPKFILTVEAPLKAETYVMNVGKSPAIEAYS
jgi:hypothetical protein